MMAASEKAFEDSISYGLSRIRRPEVTLKPLMVDQVTSLRERGVMAGIFSGHPGVSTELQVVLLTYS